MHFFGSSAPARTRAVASWMAKGKTLPVCRKGCFVLVLVPELELLWGNGERAFLVHQWPFPLSNEGLMMKVHFFGSSAPARTRAAASWMAKGKTLPACRNGRLCWCWCRSWSCCGGNGERAFLVHQ